MAKRTNSLAGTMRKGSVKHIIYDAMMAFPNDRFTSLDILNITSKKYPDIQRQTIQNMIGFIFVKMKIVKKTELVRESPDSGRKLIIYERNAKAKQPVIREQGIGPAKKPRKTARKKAEPTPVVNAAELGESVIEYINHLQERVGSLAIELDEANKLNHAQKRELQGKIDSLQYKYTELTKAKEALETQIKQGVTSNRTFDTSGVLDFKKRQAEASGRS
jgi:hypothetical protein